MNAVPPNVIQLLIELGGSDDCAAPGADQIMVRLKPFDWVNRLHCDPWIRAAAPLSESDLRRLVRGLTLAENEPRWCGGSVSGIIWTYKEFERRFPSMADELANWVLAHASNEWVPFGRMRGGATTTEEYRQHQTARQRQRTRSEAQTEDERRRKHSQEKVRKRLAIERKHLQSAQSEARSEMRAELQQATPAERVEHIAWDDNHPLSFYPALFATVERKVFDAVDSFTRVQFLKKISEQRKGAWKKLHDQLMATEPGQVAGDPK